MPPKSSESSPNGSRKKRNGREIAEHAQLIRLSVGNQNPRENDRRVLKKLIKLLEEAENPEPHARRIWENYFCSREGDHSAAAAITQHLKHKGQEDKAKAELNEYITKTQAESTKAALDIAGAYAWIWEDFSGARQVIREFTAGKNREDALVEIDYAETILEDPQVNPESGRQVELSVGQAVVSDSVLIKQ